MDVKGKTPPGLQNGVHQDTQGPNQEAPKTPLGEQSGGPPGNSTKEQAETTGFPVGPAFDLPPDKVREPQELQDEAWRLMDQAVSRGIMTLSDGTEVKLNADSLIRVIQWLASAKAKKPHFVPTPEDFNLKETTGATGKA